MFKRNEKRLALHAGTASRTTTGDSWNPVAALADDRQPHRPSGCVWLRLLLLHQRWAYQRGAALRQSVVELPRCGSMKYRIAHLCPAEERRLPLWLLTTGR